MWGQETLKYSQLLLWVCPYPFLSGQDLKDHRFIHQPPSKSSQDLHAPAARIAAPGTPVHAVDTFDYRCADAAVCLLFKA